MTRELDDAFARGGKLREGRNSNRGAYKKLPEVIESEESIVEVAQAQFTESVWSKNDKWFKGGYVVLTDRRLIALGTGFGGSGGTRGVELIPLERVLSVDSSRFVGQGIIGFGAPLRINTGGKQITYRVMPTRVADAMSEYVRARINERESGSAASRPVGDDPLEALKKLAELHDAGVLTDEEFSAKKAALLERI
ncbi:MAG: SHOCT domain-containing protein [Gaiellaceae bacterium]